MNHLKAMVFKKNDAEKTVDRKITPFLIIIGVGLVLLLCHTGRVHGEGWPEIKTRLLPDGSFATVEMDMGEKIRHCPHHDINGKLDVEQMIFVLGTLEKENWLHSRNEAVARKHLENHYTTFKKVIKKRGIQKPVNINEANLSELVSLPQIGPVLAVKIVDYRDAHGRYVTIEDIKQIDGIGQGTFDAIRHYINAD